MEPPSQISSGATAKSRRHRNRQHLHESTIPPSSESRAAPQLQQLPTACSIHLRRHSSERSRSSVRPKLQLLSHSRNLSLRPPGIRHEVRYAMFCSSNQNQSMEAHLLLKRQNMAVFSYGTGTHVKLPGPSIREPNVYEFGTTYKHMLQELRSPVRFP